MSEKPKKPVLDEQTLAKLLEAAYVLQEHNRELQQLELGFDLKRDKIEAQDRSTASLPSHSFSTASVAAADYTSTLAQIVETQHRIQVRHLELQNAISLVAERVVEIGRAAGAAIGIVKGETVQYKAVAGRRTPPAGSEVPLEKALCVSSVRTGQVFRCADVNPELLLDSEECRRRGIQSLITVPVFHEGVAVGGLELYYSEANAFTEQEVHTCQLMAGLVTEALAREEELTWKKSLANERAVMMQALEKLKPNLTALVDKPAKGQAGPSAAYVCRKCGHSLVADEQFCGQCGTPRSIADDQSAPLSPAQAPLAPEEHLHSAELPEKTHPPADMHPDDPQVLAPMSLDEMVDSLKEPDFSKESDLQDEEADKDDEISAEMLDTELQQEGDDTEEQEDAVEEEDGANELALAKPTVSTPWSSALSAREYFEQLARSNRAGALVRFWNARRGDIYLGIALILVACVIRWGIWSGHAAGAAGTPNSATSAHHKVDPDADLPFFDRMLITLGLAEAPEPLEDNGNPSVQVWVDLHTALYYCPGADLYGKTTTGKYTTQRDAQLDQFQPAYRKTCK